ncbi:C39 family peptidase [Sulfurihydrogenibium yellowstonense]|jgi:ABC-type bacteriocin/lantibiotic exporters, contain an N-terminal double-glycine peptidase domain|uniref:Peptidase, C39 family n=1 Tax=Sulfurihydrogenibium yellowstonense SS-5 TaxID=432331 RepID=C4FM91_9AQUI|nr:C39 family peptidase [Sulfurihydrogenibium yellowstonense]EEP59808.1 peptidase, C39 family [Sulfurihydrogenibium yellowstonense SS-5]
MIKKFLFIFSLLLSLSYGGEVLNVPFERQKSEFCGPASLSSVLRYYGQNISQEEIAKSVYARNLKGALITDLENFAKEKGFKTVLKKSDIDEIKKFIDERKPVIALIDYGYLFITKPHYVVIIGYNDNGFIINDGYEERKNMSYGEFLDKWEKLGKVILVVYQE